MSGDIRTYSDEVWDRFFDFVFPCNDDRSRKEVQAELQRRGVDVRPAISRVKAALESRKAREAYEVARQSRPQIISMIDKVTSPIGNSLRASLREIISQISGTEQAAYFHKLEKVTTEEDLRSLLEDIHRLDAMNKEDSDGGQSGQ